jgi:hypothetical protein
VENTRIVPGEFAGQVGQRIGRVGDDHQHRVWRVFDDGRYELAVYPRVGLEQAQPAL